MTAVEFQYEVEGRTIEIHAKPVQHMLSAELEAK
jgi:hypothetical protein